MKLLIVIVSIILTFDLSSCHEYFVLVPPRLDFLFNFASSTWYTPKSSNTANWCRKINTVVLITLSDPRGYFRKLQNLNDDRPVADLMVNGEKVVEIKKLACSRSDRPDLYIAKIKESNHIFLLGSEDGKTLTPKAIFMTYFSKQTVYSTISTGKFLNNVDTVDLHSHRLCISLFFYTNNLLKQLGNYSLRVTYYATTTSTVHLNLRMSDTQCEAYVPMDNESEVIMATYYIHAPTHFKNSVDVFPIKQEHIMISKTNEIAFYCKGSEGCSDLAN